MSKKYKPFASLRESQEWISKNCDSCKKGFDRKRRRFRCEWERKLCLAAISGKEITEKVAKAIGYLDNFAPGWTDPQCTIWECPGWARR